MPNLIILTKKILHRTDAVFESKGNCTLTQKQSNTMALHSKNLIPLDNVVHGSDGISHYIDENNLPSEIATRLTNAVVNNAVKKRLDEEIPKAISIRDAENYKIREEEKKSFSLKVNELKDKLGELEKEKELNKKQTEITFNKLKTDAEKHYLQKAKEEEEKYREIISTLNSFTMM